jgi:hypothetical protein
LSSRGGTPSRNAFSVSYTACTAAENGACVCKATRTRCRKPIEIAKLTAAAAEDQRDLDRRRHDFNRLDCNSAGEEDDVDSGRLIGLGPLAASSRLAMARALVPPTMVRDSCLGAPTAPPSFCPRPLRPSSSWACRWNHKAAATPLRGSICRCRTTVAEPMGEHERNCPLPGTRSVCLRRNQAA